MLGYPRERTAADIDHELTDERQHRRELLLRRDDHDRRALLAASRGRLDRLLDERCRIMGL